MMTKEEKIERIAEKMKEVLEILGLDLSDPSLQKTPLRIAKMYVEEVFSGLDPATHPIITFHEKKAAVGEMILVKNIFLTSFCEHHFVPMIGKVHIAYLPPNGAVLGLSKIHRIVRYIAARPQLQERLTAQIADSLTSIIGTDDIAVAITATHFCVVARGVKDQASEAETFVLRGAFEKEPYRSEFFSRISKKRGGG